MVGKRSTRPLIAIVMGVAGSGKTTVGQALAGLLGWRFQDGDALHSAVNIAKMRAGTPLTDQDRLPWLADIARLIEHWQAQDQGGVVACSALRRSYRDMLVADRSNMALIYLRGSIDLFRARLEARQGHFMPVGLLESQFATLQEPSADENPIVVDADGRPNEILADIARRLAHRADAARKA
jgi:carbohydrate kinase (thermoresistant glucokinase family)